MKQVFVILTAFALAGSSLQAAGTDPNLDYNVLQGRIASLESKIKMLETALNELSAQVAEPAPTKTTAPAPRKPVAQKTPEAPAPKAAAAPAKPASELKKYAIQEGDTISEIARKLEIPRSELMEANDLREGQQIYIGDELFIPQPAPIKAPIAVAQKAAPTKKAPEKSKPTPSKAPAKSGTYTVKAGDTLSKISREFGVSVAQIKSANNMNSDMLAIGKKLTIPGKGGSSHSTVASNTPSSSAPPSETASEDINKLLRPDENYGVYTIERGDTLYSLARDFFTTQSEIQRLNRLGGSTTLKPGQDLVVPTSKYEEHHQLANNG